MRIVVVIGMRVMLAMNRDPADRIALQRQRSKEREEIFERFAQPKAAMRENAVIAERDAERARAVRTRIASDGKIGKPKERRQERRERTDVNEREPNARAVPSQTRFMPLPFTM